jgi:anti-sigma factor RsiW
MNSLEHDRSMLGAYALGALDPREAQQVHEHLAGCPACRLEVAELTGLRAAMDEVPPEAFLDGPPEGGDLLLRRTVRAARAEHAARNPFAMPAPRSGRRLALVAASIVVLAGAALGGGILIGRETAPQTPDLFAGANVQAAETTDAATSAHLAVRMVPQQGWVRVRATVTGIPAGELCEIRVVPRSGAPVLAGSWVVSERGAREGTTLDGTALVNPAEVASIEVVNTSGRRFVEVEI